MDRPRRIGKSTKNYEDFFYPTLGKKRRKGDAKPQEKNLKEKKRQKPNDPSTSLTRNQRSSLVQSPSRPKTANSMSRQNSESRQISTPIKNSPRKKAAVTQTTQTTKKSLQEILNELYTNPEYPTAFGGELKKFILSKDTISKHRQRRKIFKRRKIFVNGPYIGVQADTINYRNYARFNSGFRYILGMLLKIYFTIRSFFVVSYQQKFLKAQKL